MKTIIATNVVLYSHPLSKDFSEGYELLCKRVCQVSNREWSWSGFIVCDTIMTTAWQKDDDNEFDIRFKDGFKTSGFLHEDHGDVIEINFDYDHHKVEPMGAVLSTPPIGTVLFLIGCFFGIPYTLARCKISKIIDTDLVIDDERIEIIDPCSCGSMVFDIHGALVGVLECYVPKTDSMVIRSFYANKEGKLKGD